MRTIIILNNKRKKCTLRRQRKTGHKRGQLMTIPNPGEENNNLLRVF